MNDTLNTAMSTTEAVGIVSNVLVALGTLLLAILAIYGERVKRWLFKPKLNILIDNKPPFVETVEDENALTKEISVIENTTSVKIKVENLGQTTALKCQGLVEKVWCKHETNENHYPKLTITPTQLDWHNNQKTFDITPHIPAYLEIAKIQRFEARSRADSTSEAKKPSDANLYLSVVEKGKKGVYTKLGKGTFIIPVIIYCDNLGKTLKYYVEIYWNGNDAKNLSASDFYIKLIDQNNVKKEIKK